MANGILASADVTATTLVTLYTVPTDTYTVASINLCNRTANEVTVRIALSTTGTPGNGEYIEYDTSVVANGVLERTGIVLNDGENIVVYAGGTGISANVYGLETPTV